MGPSVSLTTEKVFINGREIPDKVVSVLLPGGAASVRSESHQIGTLLKCIHLSSSESVWCYNP